MPQEDKIQTRTRYIALTTIFAAIYVALNMLPIAREPIAGIWVIRPGAYFVIPFSLWYPFGPASVTLGALTENILLKPGDFWRYPISFAEFPVLYTVYKMNQRIGPRLTGKKWLKTGFELLLLVYERVVIGILVAIMWSLFVSPGVFFLAYFLLKTPPHILGILILYPVAATVSRRIRRLIFVEKTTM